MHIEHVDQRHALNRVHLEFTGDGMAAQRRAVIHHAVGIRIAKQTDVAAAERLYSIGIGFGDFACRVDFIVEHHHHTLAARLGVDRHAYGVEQIERSIGR